MKSKQKLAIITLLWSAPLVIALTFILPGDTTNQFVSKIILMFVIGFASSFITIRILDKLKKVKEK